MKEKPHICFVGLTNLPVLAREYNSHGIGGEEVQQTLMGKALARRGYRVSMVVADYGQKDGESWDGVTTYKAYKFSDGIPVLRYVHPRWTGLWDALKRSNADVYYVSCAGMQVGLVSMFARKYGRRVVFKIASDDDCNPDRLLIQYWRDKKLYEYGLRRADVILAQSIQQQTALRNNYGLDSRVTIMMVDNNKHDYPFSERDVSVLWVNNLRHLKRPYLMLELSRKMADVTTHMIGGRVGGSESLFDQITDESRSISNLKFHGRVPYHDVNDFYERAKVFVNTSDIEGFPNSYLQSWIRGTPVVSFFDPDGVIEKEGLGTTVTSMDEMEKAIRVLMTDDQAWKAVSDRCKKYMEKEYGEEKILAPYINSFSCL